MRTSRHVAVQGTSHTGETAAIWLMTCGINVAVDTWVYAGSRAENRRQMAHLLWTPMWGPSACGPSWRRRATLPRSGQSCAPSSSRACTAACCGEVLLVLLHLSCFQTWLLLCGLAGPSAKTPSVVVASTSGPR